MRFALRYYECKNKKVCAADGHTHRHYRIAPHGNTACAVYSYCTASGSTMADHTADRARGGGDSRRRSEATISIAHQDEGHTDRDAPHHRPVELQHTVASIETRFHQGQLCRCERHHLPHRYVHRHHTSKHCCTAVQSRRHRIPLARTDGTHPSHPPCRW